MKKDGMPIDIDFDFVDWLIEKRKTKTPRIRPPGPAHRPAVKKRRTMQDLVRTRKAQSKARTEYWKDPEHRRQASVRSKEMWKNPEQLRKMSEWSTEYWNDPEHRREASERTKEQWKDPERRRKADERVYSEEWRTAQLQRLHTFEFIITSMVTAVRKRREKETRWIPTVKDEVFNLADSLLSTNNTTIAPKPCDMGLQQVLLYLPDALKFVGIDASQLDLPKSQLQLPKPGRTVFTHWMDNLAWAYNEEARETLLSRKAAVLTSDERAKWGIGGSQFNGQMKLYMWERKMRFADDLIVYAKQQGVAGLEGVSYVTQTGNWA